MPAAGPKRSTDANTNVSETERRALIFGILTVKEPVNRVSAARITH